MNQIYISGPLTGIADLNSIKAWYESIGFICLKVGLKPYIPHQHSDPIQHASLSPYAIYEMDRRQVILSVGLVAYVSLPSLGVGQEIEIARQHNIPVILVYEYGRAVSRMLRGNPAIRAEVVGSGSADILHRLEQILRHLYSLEDLPS